MWDRVGLGCGAGGGGDGEAAAEEERADGVHYQRWELAGMAGYRGTASKEMTSFVVGRERKKYLLALWSCQP